MINVYSVHLMSTRPKDLIDEYEKVFGMSFIEKRFKNTSIWCEEKGGQSCITIQQLKDGEPFHPVGFCLKVDSLKELEDIKKAIREYPYPEGHKKTDLSHENNILSHKDIDGNSIGIIL